MKEEESTWESPHCSMRACSKATAHPQCQLENNTLLSLSSAPCVLGTRSFTAEDIPNLFGLLPSDSRDMTQKVCLLFQSKVQHPFLTSIKDTQCLRIFDRVILITMHGSFMVHLLEWSLYFLVSGDKKMLLMFQRLTMSSTAFLSFFQMLSHGGWIAVSCKEI